MLDKANLVGKTLCQGKKDYISGGFFYGLFLAPKLKYVLTIDEFGIFQQHMTFKAFSDIERLLDRSQFFDMLEDTEISPMLPRSWKKSFKNGIVISVKMRRCDKRRVKILYVTLNNQINENTDFENNSNLLKREAPNEFGYMLPYFIE